MWEVVGAEWCFYGGCRRLSGEVNCGHLQDGDRLVAVAW